MTDRAGRLKVGVLGLGAGTLATYGRDGDVYHFYEIDPQVIEYAQGQGGYFSYLDDSAAQIEVVLGDARLSLARALRDGGGEGYDLLILDVFSGDAVPVHLLTREAFEVYLAHLESGGALAANISTSHLNMRPLLAVLADRFDLRGVVIEDEGDGAMRYASFWVLMARDPAVLVDGASFGDVTELSSFYEPDMRLWTDTYSNLLPLLR
jgi:spermidine synthase